MNFRRVLFGFSPREVREVIAQTDSSYRQRIAELEQEVERTREALARTERELQELQKKLAEYEEQKHLISEILINAHRKAQQIEAEARENARLALEQVKAQIKVKEQELFMLKSKVEKLRSLKKSSFRSSPRSTTAGKDKLHVEIESKTLKDGGIFSCLRKMTVS